MNLMLGITPPVFLSLPVSDGRARGEEPAVWYQTTCYLSEWHYMAPSTKTIDQVETGDN